MADSTITKQALAASLKALMEEMPFEKINVAQICERCGLSRKSFYYHFRDKYDLTNWIFDTGFHKVVSDHAAEDYRPDYWKLVETTCVYFYENRNFYRKAFHIKGQNSFSDHFKELLLPVLKNRFQLLMDGETLDEFGLDFFADATIAAMMRWLEDPNCMPAEEFVRKLKALVQTTSAAICRAEEYTHLLSAQESPAQTQKEECP